MRLSLVALTLPLLSLASPPFPVFGPAVALPEGVPAEDPASLEPAYRVLERESGPKVGGTREKRFWDRFSAQTKDHYEASTFELQLAKDIKAMERNRLGRHLLAKRQATSSTVTPRTRYIPPRSSTSPRAPVSSQSSSSTPRTTSTALASTSTSRSTTALATSSTPRTSSSVVTSSTPRTSSTTTSRRPPPVAPTAASIYPGTAPLGFRYGTDKIRGVNLGGWLVLEAFITPSMFAVNFQDNRIVDEYTLTQFGDYNTVYDSLLRHWSTWITEDDIRQIAAAGLNHIRIPIGFWAIDVQPGEPYLQGSLFFLTQAIGWAQKYGVKVMIDLHGVPGSQNGFDNSGRRGPILWQEGGTGGSNLARSRNVLFALSNEFSKQQYFNTVTSIQAVNEPQGYLPSLMAILKQYYYDAYFLIRFHYTSQPNNIAVVIHDAFQGVDFWNGFMNYRDNFENVLLDTHLYTMFSEREISYTDNERIGNFCFKAEGLARSELSLWTFVGEWSAATTDCAGKIPGVVYGPNNPNAIGGPSLYERLGLGNCNTRTGSGANFSASYKSTLRRWFEAQVQIYERGSGWIMWTWKMEQNAEDWSYQAGLRYGWIPQNPTARIFPPACQ